MARAYKCDICGILYEGERNACGDIVTRSIDFYEGGTFLRQYQICPQCYNAFTTIIRERNKEENDGESHES